jgi:hypothetical protein
MWGFWASRGAARANEEWCQDLGSLDGEREAERCQAVRRRWTACAASRNRIECRCAEGGAGRSLGSEGCRVRCFAACSCKSATRCLAWNGVRFAYISCLRWRSLDVADAAESGRDIADGPGAAEPANGGSSRRPNGLTYMRALWGRLDTSTSAGPAAFSQLVGADIRC